MPATREEAEAELARIGTDSYGIMSMASKMTHFNFLLEKLECRAANILKQEMLSIGGDVAVARGTVACSIDFTDAVVIGTRKQITILADKLALQPFRLKEISAALLKTFANLEKETFNIVTPRRVLNIGEHTLIMGILNVTPDSFSDGGHFNVPSAAVVRAMRMVDEGADIIDLGGESTRPGSKRITVNEELDRVMPVLERLAGKIDVPISIDTMKAEVARRAIEAGAEIINDISALKFDPEMAGVAARFGVPVVLMHMKGTPETMQKGDLEYQSLMGDIISFLSKALETAACHGIDPDKTIVDPGIGFGKTLEDNLRILKHLRELRVLGRPILVGASRKHFTSRVTGSEDAVHLEGTAAALGAAIMNGADILRVHDISFMKKVAMMADAVERA